MKVYHERFTHAQNNERHREIFDEHYGRTRESITEVVEDGIEQGVFRAAGAERMGQMITDLIHAARSRTLSLGREDAPEQTWRSIDEFILDSRVREG